MTPNESTTTRFDPKPTPCALIEDLLPLYVEGEVSPGARDLIAEHLATCEHCAGFLAGAQSVRAQLRHDQQARRSVVADDKPAVQAVTAAQFAIAIGAVLCIGMIGLFVFGFSDFYAAQRLLGLLFHSVPSLPPRMPSSCCSGSGAASTAWIAGSRLAQSPHWRALVCWGCCHR